MKTKKNNEGFTLLELVVTIVVFSIISVPLSSFLSSSSKAYLVSLDNARGVDISNYILNRLSLELRKVNHNGTKFQLKTNITLGAADRKFKFINTDGAIFKIKFYPKIGVLKLSDDSVDTVAYPLADNLTTFDFNYYQADGITDATNGSNLLFVEFQFSLVEGGVIYRSRTRVALRDEF